MTAADLHPDTGLPRPGTCCGVCPPIAGGGWDCTCPGLPGCPAADRPSVTDDARAEAERRYNSAVLHSDLTYPAHALESHRRGAFVAGAEWAAGRAETTTATTEDAVERVFQTTHPAPNTVMGWIRAGYEAGLLATARTHPTREQTENRPMTAATTEDAARVLYESGTGFKLTKGKPWEELSESSRDSQRRLAQALADEGMLATAHPTETTTEWGVAFTGTNTGGNYVVDHGTEDAAREGARATTAMGVAAKAVRREVTAWTEADQ